MNVDGKTKAYFDRLLRLEQEKRDLAEACKDLTKEMGGCGLTKEEIAGIKLAVKREFESDAKKIAREAAGDVAAALGDMATTPLGQAAVSRAAPKPRMSAPKPCDDEFDPGPELPFGAADSLAHPAPH